MHRDGNIRLWDLQAEPADPRCWRFTLTTCFKSDFYQMENDSSLDHAIYRSGRSN